MSTPCTTCRSSLGACSPDRNTLPCEAQPQCLACIFWYGTAAFPGGSFCEVKQSAPDGECPSRLDAPPPPTLPGLETDAGTVRYRVTERGPHAVAIAVFLEAEWRRDYEPAGKSRLDMHNNYVVEAMFAQRAL